MKTKLYAVYGRAVGMGEILDDKKYYIHPRKEIEVKHIVSDDPYYFKTRAEAQRTVHFVETFYKEANKKASKLGGLAHFKIEKLITGI